MCATSDEIRSLPILLRTEESLDDFLDEMLSKPRKVVHLLNKNGKVESDKALQAEFNKALEAYKKSNKLTAFKECLKKACDVLLARCLYNNTPDDSPEERAAARLELSFW